VAGNGCAYAAPHRSGRFPGLAPKSGHDAFTLINWPPTLRSSKRLDLSCIRKAACEPAPSCGFPINGSGDTPNDEPRPCIVPFCPSVMSLK
jgi:hypothetical protein